MAYEKPKAEDFIKLKDQIRNELQNRRTINPNLSSYAKNYINEPAKNRPILAEHKNIIVEQIQRINANKSSLATSKQTRVSLENLQSIIDGIVSHSIESTSSDCTAACAGLCAKECAASCSGGCQGECKTTCTGSCQGGCSSSCSGGCTGGCNGCGGCSGGCNGCGNGCTAACGGCRHTCTAACEDDCRHVCRGGCQTNCAVSCTQICRNGSSING